MPTAKPRIQVTLDQEVYDVIRRYSQIAGVSMSGFVAQTLNQAAPALSGLVEIMEVADKMSGAAQDEFISQAVGVEGDAMHLFHQIEELSKFESEGSNPLAINKGVSFSDNHQLKQRKNNKNIYLASDSSKPKQGVN